MKMMSDDILGQLLWYKFLSIYCSPGAYTKSLLTVSLTRTPALSTRLEHNENNYSVVTATVQVLRSVSSVNSFNQKGIYVLSESGIFAAPGVQTCLIHEQIFCPLACLCNHVVYQSNIILCHQQMPFIHFFWNKQPVALVLFYRLWCQ